MTGAGGADAASTGRRVRRSDVARLAGVSTAVVSYVLNNGPRPVAESTRRRVLDAIETLEYRPSAAARSLITGRSNMLALVLPDLGNDYFANLALAIEAAASERGQSLVLAQVREQHHQVVADLGGGMVDGIISAVWPDGAALREIERQRVPMVQISVMDPNPSHVSLQPDYYGGAREAVEHLIGHGHTRIALVTGWGDRAEDRTRGWMDALAAAGLPPGPVVTAPWSRAGGCRAAATLHAEHRGVTAVFVAADQQAAGLLAGLHRAGVDVPGDVAVASFDGSPEGEFTIPALTSARVPVRDLARDAVAAVLDAHAEPRAVVHPCELVVRRSCGC